MAGDIHPDAVASLLNGDHGAPFDLLGPHTVDEKTVSVRVFQPGARAVYLLPQGKKKERIEMSRLRDEGFFEARLQGILPDLRYRLEVTASDGSIQIVDDPYSFPGQFSEFDLYLLSEGRHLQSYDKLGAHLIEINGVKGVHFAVWAPNAYTVSVVGNFNNWDTRTHIMRAHENAGIWELFIPGLGEGTVYKYHIRSRLGGYRVEKSDPYAFFSELRPRTASIVTELDTYIWEDDAWMESRAQQNPLAMPMSIYEIHLGSWQRGENERWLTYRELADTLIPYIKKMHYTHIELLPVAEHPLDASWGYQVTGYFAATSRFGTPHDLMYFIDQCHQNGIGIILDWVPAHFPKDGHGLSFFDGTHLYEHADARQAEHPDWGTYIFNYGRNEVRNFLISNALFWLKKYHIDGLRVDAVSSMLYLDFGRKEGQWLPNKYGGKENLEAVDFLREANQVIHAECPGAITIAEESTAWPMVSRPTYLGGLGFTFKWNMGWMHDTLEYLQKDPVYRRYVHNKITFAMMYAFSENFVLSLSHDEVVHGKGSLINKMAGDWWQKFASLRLLHGYQVTHPGKKLMFMGQEFGQWREWSEERGLDWHLLDEWDTHAKMQSWVSDLNKLYQEQPCLYVHDFSPKGFQWIEANDAEQSIFTYLRFADDPSDFVVVACNFTPVPRYDYRIGVPEGGYYREVLNSDSAHYGGGNVGNGGGLPTQDLPWHAWNHSLNLTLPPLGILILKKSEPPTPTPE